jgi:hypothetical protein
MLLRPNLYLLWPDTVEIRQLPVLLSGFASGYVIFFPLMNLACYCIKAHNQVRSQTFSSFEVTIVNKKDGLARRLQKMPLLFERSRLFRPLFLRIVDGSGAALLVTCGKNASSGFMHPKLSMMLSICHVLAIHFFVMTSN